MNKSQKPTTIEFKNYKRTSEQLGSNPGGFFLHIATSKKYYIKWLPDVIRNEDKQFFNADDLAKGKYKNRNRNRFKNEFLAAKIYELYHVAVPKMEFITFTDENGGKFYGIASEMQKDVKPLSSLAKTHDDKDFSQVRQNTQKDFLIDVLLSNYDVVGMNQDNMFYDPLNMEPFRLDPGAALRYRAQGAPKKGEFNAMVGEYEDMGTGTQKNTKFHSTVLAQAGVVFKGVFDSPSLLISLKKLISVTDEQLKACIEDYGFDIDDTGQGEKKNNAIIVQLTARKQALIAKAQASIVNHLMNGLTHTNERYAYLKEAGIAEGDIANICSAIENNQIKEEIITLIQTAIYPSKKQHVSITKTAIKKIAFDIANEEEYFNQIIKEFLHPRAFKDPESYPGQYMGNTTPNQIQRVKHGGMHASRTALHVEKIISLLQEANYGPTVHLTVRDQFLIKVTAMFHDTGRGTDSGADTKQWEKDGAQKCKEWLEISGFAPQEVAMAYEAIANKDDKKVQENNVYALVLASCDSLDWVRSHGSNFKVNYMPELLKKHIGIQTLLQLSLVAKKIAVAQGDSPLPEMGIDGNFNIALKKTFEFNPNGCFSAVKAAYSKFSAELNQVKIPDLASAQAAAAQKAAKLEAAKLEAAKLEAARLEAARLEAAKLEAAKLEAAKLEAAKLEAAKLEAAKLEAAKLEAARLEAARLEAARLEAAKLEAAKLEAAKLEKLKKNLYYEKFNQAIKVLLVKINEFETVPGFNDNLDLVAARDAALELHTKLSKKGQDFFASPPDQKNYDQFKLECKELIETAKKSKLSSHRGWNKILINVLAIILSAGVGYVIAAGINIAVKGRFTFLSTDSSEKIADIDKFISDEEQMGIKFK